MTTAALMDDFDDGRALPVPPRPPGAVDVDDQDDGPDLGALSERSRAILDLVLERPDGVRAAEAADLLGVDRSTASVYLVRLADAGRIDRIGRGLYGPLREPDHAAAEPVDGAVDPTTFDDPIAQALAWVTLAANCPHCSALPLVDRARGRVWIDHRPGCRRRARAVIAATTAGVTLSAPSGTVEP